MQASLPRAGKHLLIKESMIDKPDGLAHLIIDGAECHNEHTPRIRGEGNTKFL